MNTTADPTKEACAGEELLDVVKWVIDDVERSFSVILPDTTNYGALIMAAEVKYMIIAPYHRNVRGISDADAIWNSESESPSKRIIAERGVDYLLLCAVWTPGNLETAAQRTSRFCSRLKEARSFLDWLESMALPAPLQGISLRTYRILQSVACMSVSNALFRSSQIYFAWP